MISEDRILSRTEKKKIDMRNKIIDVTVRLIRAKGFDGTTMEQISEEADIAKKTLYNYYPEKEAIISDFVRRTFEVKNKSRLPHLKTLEDTRARLIYIMNNLMDGVHAQKVIFEKYLVYVMKKVASFHPQEGVGSGLGVLIKEIIELGIREGDIRGDLPFTMVEDFFIFLFVEAAKQFYVNTEGFQQNDVIAKCVDLFLNGVKPMKGQGED